MIKAAETWCTWIIALKVAEGNTRRERELVRVSQKLNVVVEDHGNIWSIKVNVERSREDCLKIRAVQEKHRKTHS